jgi:hypothetical protein
MRGAETVRCAPREGPGGIVTQTALQRRAHVQPADEKQHPAATTRSHPPVRYNPDAPSEEWGWHGSWRMFAPKGSALLLWIGVITLVLFNFTEHESHVENYYFNGIALIGAIWLISRQRQARRMRRRQRHEEH